MTMFGFRRDVGLFAVILSLGLWAGCSRSTPSTTGEPGTSGPSPDSLVAPFTPPNWEELNATVTWEDQPVVDAMQRYKDHQRSNPPLVSLAEALSLKNDSPENNRKILSVLGQPPASDDEVDYEATINRHLNFEVKSTNPILGSSVADFYLAELIGMSLFAFDWDFIPFASADVVESWQSSADRMYDKVVLRDDLTWSDGKPITAHDVAFSFQAIMNPKVPAVAVRSGTDELKWVHAYDDRTVVYFHKEPLATNIWNIFFPVIPKHIYEESMKSDPTLGTSEHHIKYEANPISGGPYTIVKRSRGQEIVLQRREDWYMHQGRQVRHKPYFKEVRFQIIEDPNTALLAIKDGRIDDIEMTAEHWMTQTNTDDFYRRNTKAMGVEWSHSYIGWNVKVPFFEDKRVRQAMSYALDHDEMLKNIGYGLWEPGQGIYHPTAWMAPKPMPQPYRQDLAKAEKLLEEAGWEDTDGDGIRDKMINGRLEKFEFSLMLGSGSDTGLKIAQLLKTNLDQIGIVCNIKPTEFTVLQEDARGHKFQAMLAGWGTGSDPSTGKNLWTTKALEQDGRNYTQYTNPEIDRLFELGEKEFDRDKRAEIYGKIHTILWEDQPYTWLYYRSSFFGFNKNVRGYLFSPRNPYGYSPGFMALWKPKKAS